jgi:hypothetical protein
VVVRVEPGPQPPYFGKGRGVKVRSGDQDVDADPRTLEALFARRQDSRLIRVAQQADLYALLRLFSGTGGAPILAVRFAPALPAERVPFNPRLSSAIRNLVANEVWAVEHGTEQRYDEGVRYVGQNGTTILVVKHDGAVEFAQSLSEPRDQKVPIPLLDIAISCGTVLKLARRAHVELLGGRGAFYAGVGLSLIAGRQLAWPQNVPHTLEPTRVDAASTDTWTHDTADFRLSDSPRAFVADAIKALAYRWGYNHHADYIDTWGIVNEV